MLFKTMFSLIRDTHPFDHSAVSNGFLLFGRYGGEVSHQIRNLVLVKAYAQSCCPQGRMFAPSSSLIAKGASVNPAATAQIQQMFSAANRQINDEFNSILEALEEEKAELDRRKAEVRSMRQAEMDNEGLRDQFAEQARHLLQKALDEINAGRDIDMNVFAASIKRDFDSAISRLRQ